MPHAEIAVLHHRADKADERIEHLSARLRHLELRLALYVGLGSFVGTGAQSALSFFFGA